MYNINLHTSKYLPTSLCSYKDCDAHIRLRETITESASEWKGLMWQNTHGERERDWERNGSINVHSTYENHRQTLIHRPDTHIISAVHSCKLIAELCFFEQALISNKITANIVSFLSAPKTQDQY